MTKKIVSHSYNTIVLKDKPVGTINPTDLKGRIELDGCFSILVKVHPCKVYAT